MLTADTLLTADFRVEVAAALSSFLAERTAALVEADPKLEPMMKLARDFLAGGKRLRAAACVAGWLAVRGSVGVADERGLLAAASSLELLHMGALVHDDLIDGSKLRRGLPAAHIALANFHRGAGLRGDARAFGDAGAILLGDLLVMYSIEMFDTCALTAPAVDAARPLLAAMRAEVTAGQFLDVVAATQAPADPDALATARRVIEYKTSRYTVSRPAQVGAALAGADQPALEALDQLGSSLGRAFQLRDDVLSVFGDEAVIGKPAGDDLREGKQTVLIARAFALADERQQARLEMLVGKPDLTQNEVVEVRQIIEDCGALSAVEDDIAVDRNRALEVIEQAPFTPEGRVAFRAHTAAAIDRTL